MTITDNNGCTAEYTAEVTGLGTLRLLEAIREVLRGGVFVSRRVSASILDGFPAPSRFYRVRSIR